MTEEIEQYWKREIGIVEGKVYLFDEQDYQFVLKSIFRQGESLIDVESYLRSKYERKPHMLENFFVERCEVISLLIDEISEELRRFLPSHLLPYCDYHFFGEVTLLVVQVDEKTLRFKNP